MGLSFQKYGIDLIVMADGDYYEPNLTEAFRSEDRATFKASTFRRGREEKHADLTLELKARPGGFCWNCSVKGFKLIHGVRTSIRFVPAGKVIVPMPPGVEVELEDEGSFNTPLSSARFTIFECKDKALWVYTMEPPFKPCRIWVSRFGDGMVVDLLSEELARDRSSSFVQPLWVLEEVPGWREAVAKYGAWMEETYGLKRYEEREDVPEWAKRLALYVNVYAHSYTNRILFTFSEIGNVLGELAERFDAERTLVYIAGWDGRIDTTYPDYEPSEEIGGSEGLARLVEKAHDLGFKIMLHFNMWGVSYHSPLYERFRVCQVKDSEGRPLGWSADHNKDGVAEGLFAYVSPDCGEFRSMLVRKIISAVERYKIDAIHLDQSASYVNDPENDVSGGFRKLVGEIRDRAPHLLIEGEGMSELTVGLTPIHHVWLNGERPHPVFKELFNAYSRPTGHMDMPSLAYPKRYRKCQELYDSLGLITSLGLDSQYPQSVGAGLGEPPSMPSLDSEEALLTLEKAKRVI